MKNRINLLSNFYELVESIFRNLYIFQHSDDPTFVKMSAIYQPLHLKLNVYAKTPTKAAKLMGFCLLQYGLLQPFISGRQSGKKISVSSTEFFQFLAWEVNVTDHQCKETGVEQEITSVMVLATHSKRVKKLQYTVLFGYSCSFTCTINELTLQYLTCK